MSIFYTAQNNHWNHLDDEELLQQFYHTKENCLFTELFTRYVRIVYFICCKYLPESEDRKEMVMVIFLKLFEKIPLEKPNPKTFKNWLYTLIKNECINTFRNQHKRQKAITIFNIQSARQADGNWDAGRNFTNRNYEQRLQTLDQAIIQLKDHQRECLQLFFFENKSYKEIAHLTDYPEKRVKSYLQNAKRKIRLLLGEME